MSCKDYADLRKISPAAVSKAIKLGHRLPGVTSIKKFSRFYVLNVNELKAKCNKVAKIN